ncbi:unnamed protein product [Urochloa decumbens]|uniref:Cystatin domain-containing protein n=1 Tax=Urochloa decumbens TaxID=240449 RepID=A0ABC8YD14_9POAL
MARPLLLITLVAALAAAAAFVPAGAALGGGGRRGPLGGWRAIQNVSDPHIQELGGWALGQAQEKRLAGAGPGLRFRRVVSGEQQVVAGMNYRLHVDAADPKGRAAPYVAVVYEQLWTNTRELTSFDKAPRAH